MAFSTLCMPLRRPSEDLVTESFIASLLGIFYFFSVFTEFWLHCYKIERTEALKWDTSFRKRRNSIKAVKKTPQKALFKKSSMFGTWYIPNDQLSIYTFMYHWVFSITECFLHYTYIQHWKTESPVNYIYCIKGYFRPK